MLTEMENGSNNHLISKKQSDSHHTCTASQRENFQTEINKDRPIAWINGKSKNTGYLYHIKRIFSLLGYTIVDVPEVRSKIDGLEDDWQLVNHVPGSGYYTSKVSLATCNLSIGIPQAFEMPAKRKEFEEYAKLYPYLLWVQKSNAHRGIKVVDTKELELNKEETFVQKFVENPLLIDGRKFDIGIYTAITSISPLRVYIYDEDILLRFCPKDYLPFDPEDIDKYVVGDDYTPVWEMPSLAAYYNKMNLSFKETFNAYLRKKLNKDPEHIYNQIRQIIREVFIAQNENMRKSLKNYKNKRKFFELSRFDFVVDDKLNVFLMEANMSPNLSSDHFTQNQVLYEQLLEMFKKNHWYNKYKNGDNVYRQQFVLHAYFPGQISTDPQDDIYATFNREEGMPAIMTIDNSQPGSPTPTNRRFKAVLFDMGGVLIQYKDPMAYDRLMKKPRRQTMDELRELVADVFPGLPDGNLENTLVENHAFLDLPMHNLIRKLKQAGIKVAVVTNNGFWTPAKNRSVILTDVSKFDLVVESCRVGLRKPDPNIFILAAQKLGVDPYECIFVDDTEMHCKAARETGMTAVQAVNCDTATAAKQIEAILDLNKTIKKSAEVSTSQVKDQRSSRQVNNKLTYINGNNAQGSNISTFVWESTFV
uniref:Uncharacterized protein n=1 Tax=Ditylenchus dipsaci TaxID=166011 RepID=A0A915D0D6_9BILA